MGKTILSYGAGLLVISCLAIAVSFPLVDAVQEQPKRDDVLAVLLRMEARQIADVHPRLFKHSYMHGFCDSADFCRLIQAQYDATSEGRLSRAALLDKVEALKGKEFRQRFDAYAKPPQESQEK